MMFDVIIVGGSYAGMAAALNLARARRSILVVDAGRRRNRFAASSHGFLTRDGQGPEEIADEARRQLLAYPTVTWIEGNVTGASGRPDDFSVEIEDPGTHRGRRLILATGVRDVLPDIPGLHEQWGKTVFHCPYCHGFELQGQIGVLATGPHAFHQAMMLPDWGNTTLFTNEAYAPDEDALAQLASRGTTIEDRPVSTVEAEDGGIALVLEDGERTRLAGLFIAARFEQASPLAARLGCELDEGPLGTTIRTNPVKATSVPGVFACGDAARQGSSVSYAVADGVQAAAGAHHSMIFGKF